MSEKKHLNIDLDFLDNEKEAPKKAKPQKESVTSEEKSTFEATQEKSAAPKASTQNEKFFAALGYFSFLFVIPLLFKRKSLYCKFHALQSMLLFCSSIIVLVVLAIVPSLGSIITLVLFGFYVVAIYRAYKGDTWKMPLIGGFAAKWSGNIISVNPQKNSHVWKGLLIWAAVIAFFIWAGSLPDNKSASIPKSKEDTLLEEIVSMPEFKAKTRGMDLENNEEQASTVFNELLQDGLKRIDDQTALTRIRILSKALKIADVNTCAALARDEEAGFSDLLEKLDQSLQNQWLDTGYMAVKASLKQYPINNIDESTVEEANKILFSGLTSGESERFSGFDKDTVNLSDADTCWFIQTYYGHILTLDEPYRSSLIHSLGK